MSPTDLLIVQLLLAATLGVFVLSNAGSLGVVLSGAVGSVAVLLAVGALLARNRNARRRWRRCVPLYYDGPGAATPAVRSGEGLA